MNCEIVPADGLSLGLQAAVFDDAFAGYLAGSAQHDSGSFARLLCAQGIDLCHSRFARRENALLGFGFINRTGEIARLAGMGVVPDGRRTGVAAQLLRHLIGEAKARGDRAIMLECFEQNAAALPLYRSQGFREVTRLFGWRRTPAKRKMVASGWQETSTLEATRRNKTADYPEIPWQISRHAVVKVVGTKAFRFGDSCIVTADPAAAPVRIYGMFSVASEGWTEWHLGLTNLLDCFSEADFFAPAIFPEEFGEKIFGPLGFAREPLNQFLMRLDL